MAFDAYAECRLCPRDCGAHRADGRRGICGETAVCRIASAGPHHGEEPCFSGSRGSGTIFFTGCTCGCFFCQNWQISRGGTGEEATPDELFARAMALAARGVHNLNFVTPDHFWPHVQDLGRRLRAAGVGLPLLWNSSGYHRPEMVPAYAEVIDIFMPDFKFADPDLAEKSMGDRRYPELALASLRAMVEARGFLEPFDSTDAETARHGVLVRHLVMPGDIANSLEALRILRREFGRFLPLSVMSQFHPVPACRQRRLFDRRLTAEEYRLVREEIERCGFERAFVQEQPENDAFLPDFRREEPFKGNRRDTDGRR